MVAWLQLFGVLVSVLAALTGTYYYQQQPVQEAGSITVAMCPQCEQLLRNAIASSTSAQCAFYDVGSEMAVVLKAADARVITDDETKSAYGTYIREESLMHNKFCVLNDTVVFTGSYNPTNNGELNRNNVLIIESPTLAENYRRELDAIASYSDRGHIEHRLVVNGTPVQNYFCPRDDCERHALELLAGAQRSIVFMTFSFTSDPIGNMLLNKRAQGVRVEGICDGAQSDKYSECERLGAFLWEQPVDLHHKVFIVDERYVLTGSYNPTANGNERNRENVLIIDSPAIAAAYLAEYEAVRHP